MLRFTPKEIATIFRTARRVLRHPGLDILIVPKKYPQARLLVVTARHVGNAPTRNKIRRRLKSIFYEEKLFDQPFDCIVITKKPGTSLSFDELKTFLVAAVQATPPSVQQAAER